MAFPLLTLNAFKTDAFLCLIFELLKQDDDIKVKYFDQPRNMELLRYPNIVVNHHVSKRVEEEKFKIFEKLRTLNYSKNVIQSHPSLSRFYQIFARHYHKFAKSKDLHIPILFCVYGLDYLEKTGRINIDSDVFSLGELKGIFLFKSTLSKEERDEYKNIIHKMWVEVNTPKRNKNKKNKRK